MMDDPLVETLTEDHRWEDLGLEELAERACRATLERLGLDPSAYEISLLACNDRRIAELNEDFRGKPQPTNVLSWPSEERGAQKAGEMPHLPAPEPPMPVGLGDIAIAWETCAREAEEARKSLEAHATHLLVHGTLHLLGFDHEREVDAELMEGLETEILMGLGLADPYAPGAEGAATTRITDG
ncbi:rRNA maturation RNase YbeY [Rubellimicrobium aerolatum]|uniref:Endoribonuclease YbeY n=1 Tax=Rubellimicrobium aerolatum TaxID=490979 RepID=A0ABW0SGC1_9RHOB|nr:rRNA maturation RNase YbeY [Rubellimicrobium aerolatum]MBP1807316.1 putative rRNA maturation factor [Rubellimicrobium aerolatum]